MNRRFSDRSSTRVAPDRLRPVASEEVTFEGGLLEDRVRVNRLVTIPHIYQMLKQTGRIDAFRLDWKPGQPNKPHYFWDSDVAKWIEAASYTLAGHPNRRLSRQVDDVIALIAGAQQPDGYLNVYFTVVEPAKRWTNLRDCHELYCAGHLMEAAVAHYRATGKRTLLDPILRYADHIEARFGRGRCRGYPGHEEIELALVKLFDATGERRYLRLAKFFIDERGKQPHYYDKEARARGEDPNAWKWTYELNQSHLPVRQQRDAVGHAVRAMYLYSGMADVAAETRDAELLRACRGVWRNVTGRKMYITGGIGARRHGEAFGDDYELPSESAYAETCAAIGLVFFAHRMLQIERDAKYADVLERALYNGVLAGVSQDGRRFFYENPLASSSVRQRQPWFDCACCPPNLARLLASLGTYVYSTTRRALYVHLYSSGTAHVEVAGQRAEIVQRTRYPWDGRIELLFDTHTQSSFEVMLRIPGWCRRWTIHVNGRATRPKVCRGYAMIRRRWTNGDRVTLLLDLPVERIAAHPRVHDNVGRVTLQRGPIVYCFEQCDHDFDIGFVRLVDDAAIKPGFDSRLGGAVVLHSAARIAMARKRVKAVPYFMWANRARGAMQVWLPRS